MQGRRQRLADTSGAAPSAEMLILQKARESAIAAAAANGTGRRARVPSMKALRAAGLAEAEGAQWMSQEKHQEEARRLREYKEAARQCREYNKQLKAAELAPGQSEAGGVPVIGGSGGGCSDGRMASGASVGMDVNGAQHEAAPGFTEHQQEMADRDVITAAASEQDISNGGGDRRKRTTPSECELASDGASDRKRVRSEEAGGVEECSKTTSNTLVDEAAGNGGGEHQDPSQPLCSFELCNLAASFGVHGVARYW